MEEITVDKNDLIATLRDNMENHRELFEKAQVVYRARMVEELDRALEEARTGGTIKRAFALPIPEDHTSDFETAIQMLEWELGDQVILQRYEFEQYVMNQWGWRASFAANTQSYVVS